MNLLEIRLGAEAQQNEKETKFWKEFNSIKKDKTKTLDDLKTFWNINKNWFFITYKNNIQKQRFLRTLEKEINNYDFENLPKENVDILEKYEQIDWIKLFIWKTGNTEEQFETEVDFKKAALEFKNEVQGWSFDKQVVLYEDFLGVVNNG